MRHALALAAMTLATAACPSPSASSSSKDSSSFPPFASFATVTTTSSGHYKAFVDHVAVPPGGVALPFTVPALHVTRVYCHADVTAARAHPVVASLWTPDGTLVAKQHDWCYEDSLPSPGTSCTHSIFCPAPVDKAAEFILVVEASDAGFVELAASVTAFDPLE